MVRESIGQGIGDTMTGLFGGLPGASLDEHEALGLDMTDVPVIDYPTSRAIEDIIHDAQGVGRYAFLVDD